MSRLAEHQIYYFSTMNDTLNAHLNRMHKQSSNAPHNCLFIGLLLETLVTFPCHARLVTPSVVTHIGQFSDRLLPCNSNTRARVRDLSITPIDPIKERGKPPRHVIKFYRFVGGFSVINKLCNSITRNFSALQLTSYRSARIITLIVSLSLSPVHYSYAASSIPTDERDGEHNQACRQQLQRDHRDQQR